MSSYKYPIYQQTRAYKEGQKTLTPGFQLLADWIQQHLNVTVLNVIYQRAVVEESSSHPKLCLVIDSLEDWQHVTNRNGMIKHDFVQFVRQSFASIIEHMKVGDRFSVKDLEISAVSFSEVALTIAAQKVLKHQKVHLLQRLSRYNVYDIETMGHETSFVLYTKSNQTNAITSGDDAGIRKIYADYLSEYDRYSFFKPAALRIGYDNLEARENNRVVAFPTVVEPCAFGRLTETTIEPESPKSTLVSFWERASKVVSHIQKRAAVL